MVVSFWFNSFLSLSIVFYFLKYLYSATLPRSPPAQLIVWGATCKWNHSTPLNLDPVRNLMLSLSPITLTSLSLKRFPSSLSIFWMNVSVSIMLINCEINPLTIHCIKHSHGDHGDTNVNLAINPSESNWFWATYFVEKKDLSVFRIFSRHPNWMLSMTVKRLFCAIWFIRIGNSNHLSELIFKSLDFFINESYINTSKKPHTLLLLLPFVLARNE